jgi:hypothetical protein
MHDVPEVGELFGDVRGQSASGTGQMELTDPALLIDPHRDPAYHSRAPCAKPPAQLGGFDAAH